MRVQLTGAAAELQPVTLSYACRPIAAPPPDLPRFPDLDALIDQQTQNMRELEQARAERIAKFETWKRSKLQAAAPGYSASILMPTRANGPSVGASTVEPPIDPSADLSTVDFSVVDLPVDQPVEPSVDPSVNPSADPSIDPSAGPSANPSAESSVDSSL